ncbi:hypothetical protein ACFQHO_10505 [Actinomadura yumaensis]|uniref:hypothetical protein n=1 Tax=Actinomadura yumaensis TaxID=111807 RepID=UPI00360B3629
MQDDRREPADRPQAVRGEQRGALDRARGRKPSGPDSVAASPRPRISARTRDGPSWCPQPGTSHTPTRSGLPRRGQ